MKKILISVLGLMGLAGCASNYDYFQGDIRYVQDGKDCVYTMTEYADRFDDEIRGLDTYKKIVYRNTMCADLYARDHATNPPRGDRNSLMRPTPVAATPAVKEEPAPVAKEEPAPAPIMVPTPAQPVVDPAPMVAVARRPCQTCGMMVPRRRYVIVPVVR